MEHKKTLRRVGIGLIPILFIANLAAQSISGIISDAYSGNPVAGAQIFLLGAHFETSAASDTGGYYQLPVDIPGRYRLSISKAGYDILVAPEIMVIAGRSLSFKHELTPVSYEMETIVVRASDTWDGRERDGVEVIGIEQTERFAANFQDPSRVVSAYAGAAQLNDQANHLSIRGLSPLYAKWYLEGMEIVNPNHTNNAGTLSDIPTQAGGGVLLFSSQVLGNTFLSKGPHPIGYSNALSGIVDLHYRNPSVTDTRYTATLSLIGVEANAEGPLGKGQKSSWLANYRYSTIGLLSALGVPLGDEDIRYQDAHLQFNLSTGARSSLKLFGFWGSDQNDFEGKEDPQEREEDKERFNIRFENTLFGAGLKYQSLLGSSSVLHAGAVYSSTDAGRTQHELIRNQSPDLYRATAQANRVMSSYVELQRKTGTTGRLNLGIQAKWLDDDIEDISLREGVQLVARGGAGRFQLRPYASFLVPLSPRLEILAGMAVSIWSVGNRVIPEPRVSLSWRLGNTATVTGKYQLISQDAGQPVSELNFFPVENASPGVATGHLISAGYREQIDESRQMSIQGFYTAIRNAPIYGGTRYASQVFDAFPGVPVTYDGKERVYGIEVTYQQALDASFFWTANATVYKSQVESPETGWESARFDGGYIFNLNLGKEFEKITERLQRTWGISARLTILGGLRDREIDAARSALEGRTVYASPLYGQKLSTYVRPDLSVYLFRNRKNRTIRWSLDIQNAAGIQNAAYFYYDAVTGQVEEKTQLGIIPVLSWRIGF